LQEEKMTKKQLTEKVYNDIHEILYKLTDDLNQVFKTIADRSQNMGSMTPASLIPVLVDSLHFNLLYHR